MCGIVALLRLDGRPVAAGEVAAMRDAIAHRGPDDAGLLVDGAVGLGFRRLIVIDPEGGHQPMASADGSAHLVFNGEIYNFRELRRRLEDRGVRLCTRGDTETILGLYELYGERCVEHLHGMFAFVLWDARRRLLLAARDRLGIKPLYVLRHGATVAFASEVKALLALAGWPVEVDEEAVAEYLTWRHLAGERTLFRGVERVAPGELVAIGPAGERRRRWWELPRPAAGGDDGETRAAELVEELDELLDRVTGEHLVSDVPLGTFNSGGLDSSLITALAARRAGERLDTYSVGFDEAEFDESPYADLVARRFATRHHRLTVGGEEYARSLPLAIRHLDQPLDHPHSVHLLHLSRLARRRVTVALTGEGSDELFAGYNRYRLPRLIDRLAPLAPLPGAALRLAAAALPPRQRLRASTVLGAGGPGRFRPAGLTAFVDYARVERLLAAPPAVPPRSGLPAAVPGQTLVEALWLDQRTYLQSLLDRLDKMSMAAGLEGRVPFLDHRVVELAARVPPALKVRAGETKHLLKRLARRHLPESIIGRRKAGFAVPVAGWLRRDGPLAGYLDLLLEPRTAARGRFEPLALRRLVEEHGSGRADHGELVWGLVNLELWQRELVDGAAARAEPAAAPAAILPGAALPLAAGGWT